MQSQWTRVAGRRKDKASKHIKLRDEFMVEIKYVSDLARSKFDQAALVDLCNMKDEEEKEDGKVKKPSPTELLSLPNEKADLSWFRRTSWFSKLAKKSLRPDELRFNVEKRLETYCQLARKTKEANAEKLNGAFLLVVDYVIGEEHAEVMESVGLTGTPGFWRPSVERFELDQGTKINFRLTLLIHMTKRVNMLSTISWIAADYTIFVESVRVVDYYYFFFDE